MQPSTLKMNAVPPNTRFAASSFMYLLRIKPHETFETPSRRRAVRKFLPLSRWPNPEKSTKSVTRKKQIPQTLHPAKHPMSVRFATGRPCSR